MRKPTTWSKFLDLYFLHKNYLPTLNDHHLKYIMYKGYFHAIYRDMTS